MFVRQRHSAILYDVFLGYLQTAFFPYAIRRLVKIRFSERLRFTQIYIYIFDFRPGGCEFDESRSLKEQTRNFERHTHTHTHGRITTMPV